MKKDSLPIKLLDDFYRGANITSYQTFNNGLQDFLRAIVSCGIKFNLEDYSKIRKGYKSAYWLRVSQNGKHSGEFLYEAGSVYDNISFCQSYEHSENRETFILNNKRLHEGSRFFYDKLYFTVTGWSEDNQKIKCVGYKNGMKEGKRKLIEFDKETFLKERKTIKGL